MDFIKIKNAVRDIHFEEIRLDKETYFEVVITKEELNKLKKILESFFGTAIFPSENKLPSEISQTISPFGAIWPGQTLYYSNDTENTVFAMLWPWQDNQHTTLKIIKR